jgi:putative transposase
LNRSHLYYPAAGENEYNLLIMKLMDEEYTRYPFKGVLKMTAYLKELEHNVNIKRVRRLLRLMGLEAIYPKKNLSKAQAGHKKYPYLLNGLNITRPNQVWSSDITYIRLAQGFVYLTAIMDWYSRYVLSWRLSNSLDASFCIDALEDALMLYGFPEIFNSDQGCQYTSDAFTGILLANGIKISMDGRGRAFDNIFIERLWRSVKYEEVYLHDYFSVKEAKENLYNYFNFYNYARYHQSLEYKKPAEIYFGKKIPVDYVNNVNNGLLVPRKVIHIINVGPQAQQ